MKKYPIIFVVGSGAFGSALSSVIASSGKSCVTLLGRQEALIKQLEYSGINTKALPGIKLSNRLFFSTDYKRLSEADIVFFATSSYGYGEAINFYGKWLSDSADIVICSKGFERHTGTVLSDYSEKTLPSHNFSVLSGPGFATELARGLPVAVTLASKDIKRARYIADIISNNSFCIDCSDDRIGVQLGGALKNIVAIAIGILEGRKIGDSSRAVIMVRGLSEMAALSHAMGGRSDTIYGLSGLGDLVLTATSEQSRNFSFGVLLGKGNQYDVDKMGLVEGGFAASRAIQLAFNFGLNLPIFKAISDVVVGNITVDEAIKNFFKSSFIYK
ncbi:NAD(P)H-dependent glycerol-3-phosphate dehydrogenase [Candidatus Liberibacter americanus]|uniref:Glycerol-3-phosphate dehydrogenase [NAD(P)+] n=1 Tax=Candidatus Liberibacter americanus str. Sao Paulo TaxID=1261131 RepID=U6B4X8_9HYPH|nr:NAD(P)H-dependent glycerol-3-phosphate dehydrogenase [Candidatus Liberibacter americanus]AHA28124.1 Glycerol 3-phosphate dehydrogenase [Candidatus Liberibacter americanus str. Sao Paulo]EMS36029.1 glycerol-3-phosphate dehydrogenase [Candidatus Liberibacter americanus PW_SP]